MKFKPIEEIEGLCKRVAEDVGVEFVGLELKSGQSPSLTVFADTEDGMDLVTCEKYHRALDPLLDEMDVSYGETYTFNVSSPGLDRPLKTTRDFERALGEDVEVRLYAPLKGKKLIEGVLADFDDNTVTVETEGGDLKVERTRIAKICKAVKFD